MATATQDLICEALGFEAPGAFDPWYPGAFSRDGIPVVIRHLPYLPEINGVLRAHGFRWDGERKEWYGSDETEAQVSVLQALHYCAGRYYEGACPPFAVFVGGSVPEGRLTKDGRRPATGGRPLCPVRVGAYACD